MSTVMGIMFFVAGGSVLYFKQYTELSELTRRPSEVVKIGISSKEVKSIVGKEIVGCVLSTVDFGAFLGVSLIYLMTYIVALSGLCRFSLDAGFRRHDVKSIPAF